MIIFKNRNCVCIDGWTGGACDICNEGNVCDWSVIHPQILFILPQAGAVTDLGNVFVHGRGFLRYLFYSIILSIFYNIKIF